MKAQVSVEFMISLSIMLLLFLLLSGIASQRFDQAMHERIDGSAKAVLATFVMNLNSVFIGGEGATLSIDLPLTIENNDGYAIHILPGTNLARITYANPGGMQYYDLPLITRATTGRTEGINGTVTFTNQDQEVLIG